MNQNLSNLLKNIEIVIFDFDGVFTTNQVIVLENGLEGVICSRSDGLGLDMLRRHNIYMVIVSTEKNPVVAMRAKKLKLDCHHGLDDKEHTVRALAKQKKVSLEKVAYLGNDINDLKCLKIVGLPVVVADAFPETKEIAKLILMRNGGDAAVREFCEMLAEAKDKNG